jgi:hypothetical protein
MAKRKTANKDVAVAPAVFLKKPKPKKKPSKVKPQRLDIEKIRELMKTHKPPQSWYDENFEGLS